MASSSSIIASIDSLIVKHLSRKRYLFSSGSPYILQPLRCGVWSLNVYVVCLRKFGKGGLLGSSSSQSPLTSRIQDALGRVLKLLQSGENTVKSLDLKEIHCLVKETDEWYNTIMSNHTDTAQSTSLTPDDIAVIADSILNIALICHTEVKAFGEQLATIKSLLLFILQTSVENQHLQNLLIHFEAVAINAAHAFVNAGYESNWEDFYARMERQYSLLAQRVNPFDPQMSLAYTEALSTSRFSTRYHSPTQDMDMDMDDHTILQLKNFLDSLISVFWNNLLVPDPCQLDCTKDQLHMLYEGLRFARTILKQQPKEFDNEIVVQIGVFVCEAGILVFSSHQTINAEMDPRLPDLLERIKVVQAQVEKKTPRTSGFMEDIRGIKTEAKRISYGDRKEIEVQKMMGTLSNQPPVSPPSTSNAVVGFHNEAASIVNQLTRQSKQLRMILICGMGGVGKTTLAFKVYNDTWVTHYFHARAWCSVSQVLDKKKVLAQLLNQIHPAEYGKMTEDDLMVKLYRTLKGKRYLIFLDDVWNIEVWNSLNSSFPDDSNASRILLTGRHGNIGPPKMCYKTELVPLNFQDSLTLLQMKLFHGGERWPSTLIELGKQIAEKCRGLPLTIVVVAGLLAKMKQESWKDILDALRSGIESRTEVTEQCVNTLELSYKCLPDYLKPCLLYFGGFPEDEEVSVKKLIRLWIAEGFIRKIEPKRIEDVAEEYMAELIERSLVMVGQRRSIGGAKTCRVHDLIHDFCVRRAKQESFYYVVRGQLLDFKEPCYLQRLFIHSKLADFSESVICPRARSLLFFPPESIDHESDSFKFCSLKSQLLKVLDTGRVAFSGWFPIELGLHIQLKYVSIELKYVSIELKYVSIEGQGSLGIPSSIGNLLNLETLILLFAGPLTLPPSIFNLKRLKYLQTTSFGVELKDLGNSPCLSGLETFSWAIITNDNQMTEVVRKFPNIRRLKLQIPTLGNFCLKTIPGQLESLAIAHNFSSLSWECGLPANLRKVKLMYVELSRREISIIGKLPNLQVLKLEKVLLSHNTLEMEEGEFLQLRFLKLSDEYIFRWIVCDELPRLQRLVLRFCRMLEEIPTCLESIPTLEEIDVSYCSNEVVNSVRHIEKEQMELGNHIKIHIN